MDQYYTVLENGQSVFIDAKDQDDFKRIVREKNLASKLIEKEIA